MGVKRIEQAQIAIEKDNNNLTQDIFRQGNEEFLQYVGIFPMLKIAMQLCCEPAPCVPSLRQLPVLLIKMPQPERQGHSVILTFLQTLQWVAPAYSVCGETRVCTLPRAKLSSTRRLGSRQSIKA
jgi:hypothetical protein